MIKKISYHRSSGFSEPYVYAVADLNSGMAIQVAKNYHLFEGPFDEKEYLYLKTVFEAFARGSTGIVIRAEMSEKKYDADAETVERIHKVFFPKSWK